MGQAGCQLSIRPSIGFEAGTYGLADCRVAPVPNCFVYCWHCYAILAQPFSHRGRASWPVASWMGVDMSHGVLSAAVSSVQAHRTLNHANQVLISKCVFERGLHLCLLPYCGSTLGYPWPWVLTHGPNALGVIVASETHANGIESLMHTPLQSCCVMENNRETQPRSLAQRSFPIHWIQLAGGIRQFI